MKIISKCLLLTALSLPFSAHAGDWSLRDSEGARHTLSSLQGKWVLVNFWAPWCTSCIQEIPGFVATQKQRKDLQIIGVAVMYKKISEVMEIVKSQAISYPVVFGNEDIAGDFGGMAGIPTSFLYSPSGKLAGKHSGPLTQNEIEQAIEGNAAALFTR